MASRSARPSVHRRSVDHIDAKLGLFDYILPMFTARTGIDVRVVAVGTGQALKNAMNGDGDVLLVHAKPDEEAFVAAGWGVRRHDVMYNDFVIVGPTDDPARVAGSKDAASALRRIAETKSAFVSRGDDSGTHKAELASGATPASIRGASGTWYREAGSGGGDAQHGASHARLRADRSGDVGLLRQQGRPRHTRIGRPEAVQSVRRHTGNPARHPRRRLRKGKRS